MYSLFPFLSAEAAINDAVFARAIDPIISSIVIPIVQFMFAIGIVVFVYGIIEMIIKSGDEKGREQGKQHMLYGIIGIFIMVSAWGIIYLISNSVNSIDKGIVPTVGSNTISPTGR